MLHKGVWKWTFNEVYLAWMHAADSAYDPHYHQLEHVDGVAPTRTENGIKEAWKCSICGHYFTNEGAMVTLREADIALPAAGHAWGTPSYEWAEDNSTCTATRICANDASHVETETVNTSSEVTKEPTGTKNGVRTYTATFTNPAFETQKKTEAIPATGPDDPTPTPKPDSEPTPSQNTTPATTKTSATPNTGDPVRAAWLLVVGIGAAASAAFAFRMRRKKD